MRRVVIAAILLAAALAVGATAKERRPTPRQVTEAAFKADRFSDGAKIDNKFLPLTPGKQFIYEGRATRDGSRGAHRIVFTVTDLTKVIYGVRTLVIWDRDLDGDRLAEQELAFFAQDDDRNIWALGEYPEEYEGGKAATPSVWIVGRAGARPGLHLQGDPRPGTPTYSQGYAPKIGWGDVAKVISTGTRTCVPVGCYANVLQTDETNPLEPDDGHQRKFYAAGVGNVRVAPGPGDKDREVLRLVQIRRLSPGAMVTARRRALALDKRAYRNAKAVYGRLPAMERLAAR